MKRRISVQVGDGLPKPPKPKKLRKVKIPQIKIKMTKKAIRATTRKLKARWSPETIQDIAGFALVSPK